MRSALAAAMLGLLAPACFDGKDALGLACEEDYQCGRGQTCENNFCGGTPKEDPVGDCKPPPPPTWCGDGTEAPNRVFAVNEFSRPEFSRATAVVAGDFTGGAGTDIALLSFDSRQLHMVSNEDGEFTHVGTLVDPQITSAFDLIASDRDCNSTTEFAVLSNDGHVTIANWNGMMFEIVGGVNASSGAFSFAAADLIDDDDHFPDLVVSSSAQVDLVSNVEGRWSQAGIVSVGMDNEFYEPWDTLIIGAGADALIVVPASDDTKMSGERDMIVHLLQVTGSLDAPMISKAMPPDVKRNFRNPWAVAQGDFDGDGMLELAVAERNVNATDEGTNEPGRLRILRLSFADAIELVWEDEEMMIPGIPTGVGLSVLATADLDCDHKDDLVLGNSGALPEYPATTQVMFGVDDLDEDATLVEVPELTGVHPGSRLAVGDFDGDGRPDVAIPDYGAPFGTVGARFVVVGVDQG